MKNNLIKTIILLLSLLLASPSYSSSTGESGQFLYYGTGVYEKIDRAQKTALNVINSIPEQDWDNIFRLHKTERADLIEALSNLKYSELVSTRIRNNKEIMLDYIVEDGVKKIEILKEFLERVLHKSYAGSISQNLIHEALHFSGYNQDEAWELSDELVKSYKNNTFRYCKNLYKVEPEGRCVYSFDIEPFLNEYRQVSKAFTNWFKSGETSPIKVIARQVSFDHHISKDNTEFKSLSMDLSSSDRKISYMEKNDSKYKRVERLLPTARTLSGELCVIGSSADCPNVLFKPAKRNIGELLFSSKYYKYTNVHVEAYLDQFEISFSQGTYMPGSSSDTDYKHEVRAAIEKENTFLKSMTKKQRRAWLKKNPRKNEIDTETEVQSHIHTVDQVNAVFIKDLN